SHGAVTLPPHAGFLVPGSRLTGRSPDVAEDARAAPPADAHRGPDPLRDNDLLLARGESGIRREVPPAELVPRAVVDAEAAGVHRVDHAPVPAALALGDLVP